MTTGASTPSPSTRPRRSRPLRFLPLGIAAWLVLEIWLLTVVADAAGGLAVFLIIAGGLVLGATIIKRAGRRAFRNLSETLRQQQSGAQPASAGTEGNGLMMLGGLLLMIPGMISDALGLLLLIPPVQKALGRYTERTIDRRVRAAATRGGFGDAFQQARIHRPDGKIVQGEVVRDDEPRQDRRPGPRPPLSH
ncbi:FxsA family membrane protein [Streptomyces sp. NPDC008313]|uniref:FxsA family membrane protein n=1 Tax=Streptomyces sp. NPDC008313 TaxID=3364826 RepID=UPI0036E41DB3